MKKYFMQGWQAGLIGKLSEPPEKKCGCEPVINRCGDGVVIVDGVELNILGFWSRSVAVAFEAFTVSYMSGRYVLDPFYRVSWNVHLDNAGWFGWTLPLEDRPVNAISRAEITAAGNTNPFGVNEIVVIEPIWRIRHAGTESLDPIGFDFDMDTWSPLWAVPLDTDAAGRREPWQACDNILYIEMGWAVYRYVYNDSNGWTVGTTRWWCSTGDYDFPLRLIQIDPKTLQHRGEAVVPMIAYQTDEDGNVTAYESYTLIAVDNGGNAAYHGEKLFVVVMVVSGGKQVVWRVFNKALQEVGKHYFAYSGGPFYAAPNMLGTDYYHSGLDNDYAKGWILIGLGSGTSRTYPASLVSPPGPISIIPGRESYAMMHGNGTRKTVIGGFMSTGGSTSKTSSSAVMTAPLETYDSEDFGLGEAIEEGLASLNDRINQITNPVVNGLTTSDAVSVEYPIDFSILFHDGAPIINTYPDHSIQITPVLTNVGSWPDRIPSPSPGTTGIDRRITQYYFKEVVTDAVAVIITTQNNGHAPYRVTTRRKVYYRVCILTEEINWFCNDSLDSDPATRTVQMTCSVSLTIEGRANPPVAGEEPTGTTETTSEGAFGPGPMTDNSTASVVYLGLTSRSIYNAVRNSDGLCRACHFASVFLDNTVISAQSR